MIKPLGMTLLWLVTSLPTYAADLQTISNGRSLVISCQHALKILNRDLDPIPTTLQTNAFICFSYISGVMGGARYMETLSELRYAQLTSSIKGNIPPFSKSCIDWNIQFQKAAQIVVKFAQENPDELRQDAHGLVLRALTNAYPCRMKTGAGHDK